MTWKRVLTIGLTLGCSIATQVDAQMKVIEGRAVTGINRILGEPFFDFGAPFGTIGFTTVAAHDPGGTEPLPLTPASPPETLLASTVDPLFFAVFGVPPESVDPATLNVPLRDVAVITGFAGERSPIGSLLAGPQLAPGRAPSNGAITLGNWLRAHGTARIRCHGANAPRIDFAFSRLVPHGLYSVWGGMLPPSGPTPVALGGLPNAFVADDKGSANFSARLNYCPLDLKPGEVPLAFMDVVLHSDHALYGAVPEQLAAGLPPGIVTQVHVEFPVAATPVD